MKKRIQHFTLVEMLTVIAIIGILAGLIIPTVVIAQRRGRETQAKSDISSIMTAMKQFKSDYNRILPANRHVHKTEEGSTVIIATHPTGTPDYLCLLDQQAYDAFIAELSVPKNKGIDQDAISDRINKRKRVYLDPKNGFNATESYKESSNQEKLWRDPWGNPYVIYLNRTGAQELELPGTDNPSGSGSLTLATDIAIYSQGPNGEDDKGCNSALEKCIMNGGSNNHKSHDDISSWNL